MTEAAATAADTAATPKPEINCSRQFTEWMAEQKLSLAFTTYQTGLERPSNCNPAVSPAAR
jgi:hypothetical protein